MTNLLIAGPPWYLRRPPQCYADIWPLHQSRAPASRAILTISGAISKRDGAARRNPPAPQVPGRAVTIRRLSATSSIAECVIRISNKGRTDLVLDLGVQQCGIVYGGWRYGPERTIFIKVDELLPNLPVNGWIINLQKKKTAL